jgi:hypothetical protein
MKTSMLILASAFLLTQAAFAGQTIERKLFTLEKSLNSENTLNIHTQTDENCKFVSSANGYVDFYWLMDGKNIKQVHPMIRTKVQERVQFIGINEKRDSFKVRLNDLSEIRHDLESNTIEARAEIVNGTCTVNSIIQLGASAKYKKLNLQRTFCEVNSLMGIPNGCKYLELAGSDNATGEGLKARFKGK